MEDGVLLYNSLEGGEVYEALPVHPVCLKEGGSIDEHFMVILMIKV